jgi:glucans biosynthesis protein C
MRKIERLHYMDTLRAVAMFLGLVLHAAVIFTQWTLDFARQHDESSLFLHGLAELIHVFRMELFFLVAGFFSLMLCRSRGIKDYVKNRTKRIVVPFLLCVMFLLPWIASQFSMDVTASQEPFLGQYLKYFSNPFYILNQPFPVGNWFWHFWFLHLLIYFIAAFATLKILCNALGLHASSFSWILAGAKGKFGLIYLSLLTYPILLFSPPWADVPGIATSLDVLIYYGLFFFAGTLFFANPKTFESLQGQFKYHLIPFIIALLVLIPLIDRVRLSTSPDLLLQNYSFFASEAGSSGLLGTFPLFQNPFNLSSLHAPFQWHAMCLLRAYTTWCAIMGMVTLFKRFFSSQTALGRYAADASYFVYLIHFPIQLSMAYYLRDHLSSAMLGFWICLIASTVICVTFYHFTCRNTVIGTLLSGKRYSLKIGGEVRELKALLQKKKVYLSVITLAGICFMADRYESRTEKRLLYFSLHAEPENIKSFMKGKHIDTLKTIRRWDGRGPLHMAAHQMIKPRPDNMIEQSVSALLEAGLDPNNVDNFGQTPLHYAVRMGNKRALELLLEGGANPNAKETSYGNTPLHFAATIGSKAFIDPLVQAGADLKLTRDDGKSAEQLLSHFHPNTRLSQRIP